MTCLLRINVVKVVLEELDTGAPVGRVEFVWNVPAEWTELSAFLRQVNGHKAQQYKTYHRCKKNCLNNNNNKRLNT